MLHYQSVNYLSHYCEPTDITVNIQQLRHTINIISKYANYTTLEWEKHTNKQSTLALSYPPNLPQKYFDLYGNLAYYRCSGSELDINEQGFYTKDMTLLTELVSSSLINSLGQTILEYHKQKYSQYNDYIGRIHLATLGPGTAFSFHIDRHITTRYHIAITTHKLANHLVKLNNDIFIIHIPVDSRVWHLDTSCWHSAQNLSLLEDCTRESVTRTHLIYSICTP